MEEPAAEEMQYEVPGPVFDPADIVIKQEPQDDDVEMMLIAQQQQQQQQQHSEDEVMEPNFAVEDNCDDEHQVYPHPEEISDVILQRAVSPPTYADHCDPEELLLFYKEKFQLKDLTVQLENCDKIWETLQLIKTIQGDSNDDDDDSSYRVDSPKNSLSSHSESPIPTIPYEPTIGNNNAALPDFRFSVKSKKRLYHCVSCGKEYGDSQQLRQHAYEDHGVYVNPKRVYKPRADMVAKTVRQGANVGNEGFVSGLQNPNNMVKIPLSQTTLPPVELSPAVQTTQILDTEDAENSTLSVNAIVPEPQPKTSNHRLPEIKEKFKCVLCKRICADIIYHLKSFHKVGCVSSILAQCEKLVDDVPVTNKIEPVSPSQEVPEDLDLTTPLAVTVRKRKRPHTRWTVPKKRFKQSTIQSTRLPTENPKVGFKKYKCDICFGIYKTPKSFSYHRKLHRMRGETPENFDPSRCRFKNSPLCATQTAKVAKDALGDHARSPAGGPVKVQPSTTDYPTSESPKPVVKTEEPGVPSPGNQNSVEPTVCDCGRSFRTYHTLFLHKVKCREIDGRGNHDSDSGVGISIKIKKKNDSYEVVPRTTPTEERSCKDSDASSNDSGVVSVDSNSRKADSAESAKYKTHSVMRIRVEEKDEEEEVDIEDENSNQSNFNGNCYAPLNGHAEDSVDAASTGSTENDSLRNGGGSAKSSSRRSSNIPSLSNLCRLVLSKSKGGSDDEVTPHRCLSCRSYFKTTTDLMEHASKMKHDAKSLCSCGKEFKSLKYYNIHVRRFHPLLLNCSYCMTNFDRIEKYLGHKCHVTEGKLFIEPIIQTQCSRCKALVDLGEPFDKHMKTHSGDSATFYHCYKCELTFDNPYQRRSHFSKEHGFSPCRICGKVLHIDHLSRHDAYHDGLGHPCHLCKKTFSQKSLLKRHVQGTHDPLVNEVVRCIVCAKNVKLRYLKKHMSFHLHTEICKKCNKCYRSEGANGFEEHMASEHPDDSATEREEHERVGACENGADDPETSVVQNATSSV